MIRQVQVENLAIVRGDRLLFEGLNFTLASGQALFTIVPQDGGAT